MRKLTVILLSLLLSTVAMAQTDTDSGWINNPNCYAYGYAMGDSVRVYADFQAMVVRMDGPNVSRVQVYPAISEPGFNEQNLSPNPNKTVMGKSVTQQDLSDASTAHQFYTRWQARKDELFRNEADPSRVAEILFEEIKLELPSVTRNGNTLLIKLPDAPLTDLWTIEAPEEHISPEQLIRWQVAKFANCLRRGSFVCISSKQDDIIAPGHPNFQVAIDDVRLAQQIGKISPENWAGKRLSYEVAREFQNHLALDVIQGED